MGRPALTNERREQILDAFERCLGEHGLEGTTLDAVAGEAGLQRAAIRHFVGNRDELIEAGVDHIALKYRRAHRVALGALQPEGRATAVVDFLFVGGFTTSDTASQDRAVTALIAAAVSSPAARTSLRRMYAAFEATLTKELAAALPTARSDDVGRVAYAVMCMAEHHGTMLDLGVPKKRGRDARWAALVLIDSLRGT